MRVRGQLSVSRVVPVVLTAVALGAPISPTPVLRLIGPESAWAQDRRLPSPVLLKRLAEAVDGYRGGESVWVVASYTFPHHVVGTFTEQTPATSLAGRDTSLAVFGPYRAPTDSGMAGNRFLIGCVHLRWTSEYRLICPEGPPIFLRDIAEVSLVLRLRSGEVRTMPMSTDIDAAFFSLAAIEKFVIPYYARTLGAEAAAAMHRDILGRITAP